jgi:hypothetical protein
MEITHLWFKTKQDGAAVRPHICVLEVPGSNIGRDPGSPDQGFHIFPQSFQVNARIIAPDCFLPIPFKFFNRLWALSYGVKQAGREDDHSPPSSAEVSNGGAIPPLTYMSSWLGA